MKNLMEAVKWTNKWNWGYETTIIQDGCGVVEIQFQDGVEWGYLTNLKVHPSRMKQGIAAQLMTEAEKVVEEEGYDEIQLYVEKERVWQKEWYERLGYKVITTHDKGYTMRKLL